MGAWQVEPVVLKGGELADEIRPLRLGQLRRLVAEVGLDVAVEDDVVPAAEPRREEGRRVGAVLRVERGEEERVERLDIALRTRKQRADELAVKRRVVRIVERGDGVALSPQPLAQQRRPAPSHGAQGWGDEASAVERHAQFR